VDADEYLLADVPWQGDRETARAGVSKKEITESRPFAHIEPLVRK
jgi:hypothetical protein